MNDLPKYFKSLLFLNGQFDLVSLQSLFAAAWPLLISADGAAWKMQQSGLMPDLIIGDLDSLKSVDDWESIFSDSEIIYDDSQQTNDFEKSLSIIRNRSVDPCLIAGMQGGDLEHSFNNWSILIKFCSILNLAVFENNRIGLPLNSGQKLQAACPVHSVISLLPQPECRLSTEGLEWPLRQEELKLGHREGARNRVCKPSGFSVHVESGSLLAFIPATSSWQISTAH